MAGAIKGIKIEFRGDTTSLDKALNEIQKEGKETQTSLNAVNKALKFNPGNTELIRQKFGLLQQKVNSTENELKQLKKAEQQLTANNVSEQSKEWGTVQRKIIEAKSKLSHYKAQLNALKYEKIASMGKTFSNVGSKMQSVGRNMSMYVSAPVAGIGAAAVKTGMQFDEQMSKVKAISGATGKDFTALRDKAREMGAKTKFSATEAGEGFEYMAMAGWDTNSMLKGIKPVLDLAAASGEDLGTTSDIVTDAMTAFGLEAKDAGHFADVLATTSTKANTNVGMMGESFKYVAPVAGSMGYKVEDVSLALGLMANAGIKASSAGTSLRTLMTNMAKPTDAMKGAMEKLGVSLTDSNGNMKSFKQVMDDLRKGFGNLKMEPEKVKAELSKLDQQLSSGAISQKQYDTAQQDLMKSAFGAEGALKAEAAATLAGKTGMSGLMAIISASPKDYDELSTSIANCDGSAKKMADTMIDNNAGAFTILKSALSEAAIAINDRLAPVVKSAISFVQGLVDKFNKLPQGMQDTIIKIGAVVAAIGPLLLVGGTLLKTVGGFMTALPGIMGTLPKLAGFITSTGSAIKGLATGTSLLKTPMAGVLGIAALLATAFVLLMAKSESFRKAVGGLVTQIGSALKPILTAIMNAFKQIVPVIGQLAATIGNALAPVIKAIVPVIGTVISIIAQVVAKIVQVLTPAIKVVITVVQKILSVVGPVLNGLLNIISSVFRTIKKVARTIWNGIKTVILGVWNALKKAASVVWNAIKNVIMVPINALKKLLTAAWNAIKTAASAVWNGIKTVASAVWNGIKNVVMIPINALKTALSAAWNAIKSAASAVWNGIKTVATTVWNGIKNVVMIPINALKTALATAWNAIKTKASELWNGIKTKASEIWTSIKEKLLAPVRAARETLANLWGYIKEKASNIWTSIKEKAANVWTSIKEKLLSPVRAAREALANIWGYIKEKASNVWNGIKEKAANIWSSIKDKLLKPVRAAREALANIWGYIKEKASNVWNGIKDTASAVWTKVKEVITAPIKKAKEIIKGIIDKIKGFFDFDFELPDIKLPHFYISPKGWELSDLLEGEIPSLGIEWYAKGGIFTKPTVIGNKGFGEAGAEAALPLKVLWDEMSGMFRMMGDNIVNGVMTGMAAQSSGETVVTIPVYLYPNSQKMGEETVRIYDRYKKILG